VGVYFCGGFVDIAVDVSAVGDYEKLIILAIIAGVRSYIKSVDIGIIISLFSFSVSSVSSVV
jgi:hypothetical protein